MSNVRDLNKNQKDFDSIKKNNNSQSSDKKSNFASIFIFTNIYVDLVVYFLISFALYCSFLMYNELDSHNAKLKSYKPNYKFPKKEDLFPSIWMFLILMFLHKIFKMLTIDTIEKNLSKKYEDIDEITIYKNKVATNFVKLALYTSSTILGYYALSELNFFPWTLGGSGEYKNIFSKGFPEYLFFEKTEYFDFYYNYNLAFALFDTYILISYPSQSDFLLMILHHIVTLNLVVFSFLTNFSNIGSIVYFVFYSGDILSMVVRILIHLNIPEIISCYLTFAFLIVFTYTRLFVFGDVLYRTYGFVLFYDYNIYSVYLCCFLGVLMVLNIIWIVLITKKVYLFLKTGDVEEIYKIKKSSEKVKAK